MYTNIGKKIKILAVIICLIGVALAIYTAFQFWMNDATDYSQFTNTSLTAHALLGSVASVYFIIGGVICTLTGITNMAVLGIFVLVLGSLFAWVSSFLLYGLGQLIDTNEESNKCLKEIHRLYQNKK